MRAAWAALLLPTLAWATPHTHEGVFARLGFGVGGLQALGQPDEGAEVRYSGTCGLFDIGLGWSLTERLAVHISLGLSTVSEPTYQLGDHEDVLKDHNLSNDLAGVGATYFFDRFYLTGAVGRSSTKLEREDDEALTAQDSGLVVQAGIGKLWPISDEWWLGAEFLGRGAKTREQSRADDRLGTFWVGSLGLMLSALYN